MSSGDRDSQVEIDAYLAAARADRVRRFRRLAAVFALGAVATGAMATRMTDIGHATGFMAVAGVFVLTAVLMLLVGRAK